jgi:hypothetical protein
VTGSPAIVELDDRVRAKVGMTVVAEAVTEALCQVSSSAVTE